MVLGTQEEPQEQPDSRREQESKRVEQSEDLAKSLERFVFSFDRKS